MDAEESSEDNINQEVYLNEVQQPTEPTSDYEALKDPRRKQWIEAMKQEIKSLLENKTWDLTDLPSGRKTIKNRWFFRFKKDRDGKETFKARLVAQGTHKKKVLTIRRLTLL
jgi:hypothetical protein